MFGRRTKLENVRHRKLVLFSILSGVNGGIIIFSCVFAFFNLSLSGFPVQKRDEDTGNSEHTEKLI